MLSPALDEWLRTAILKGAVDQGFFQYQGSLNQGAAEQDRSISLFFKVHDAELAFQPGWPHVSKVSGDVFVEDSGVRILASKGQLLDTQVSDIYVNIPHVASGQNQPPVSRWRVRRRVGRWPEDSSASTDRHRRDLCRLGRRG